MKTYFTGVAVFCFLHNFLQQRFCDALPAVFRQRIDVEDIGNFSFQVVVKWRLVIENYTGACHSLAIIFGKPVYEIIFCDVFFQVNRKMISQFLIMRRIGVRVNFFEKPEA